MKHRRKVFKPLEHKASDSISKENVAIFVRIKWNYTEGNQKRNFLQRMTQHKK